jgi:superfamily I DNA/RNA helicase
MKLPKLDDLIGEQMDVYEHDPKTNLFVVGPPGSGKTSLMVVRAKLLMAVGQNVVIITRNRMLAALAEQLSDAEFSASTMHSFVYSDHWRIFNTAPPLVEPYKFNWNAIFSAYTNAAISPTLDHVLIDEGQNLPPEFFSWIIRFKGKTVTVFADEDQSTDLQRSRISDICAAGLPYPLRLTTNHRNTDEISLVAEHFHRSAILPPGVVIRGKSGEKPQLLTYTSWGEIVDRIATRYLNRGTSIGVIVWRKTEAVDMVNMLKKKLPSNVRVESYTSDTPRHVVPTIRTFDPGITVLTGESVIGLEFDEVFLQDLERSLPCEVQMDFRRMYMLCARARDNLFVVNGPNNLNAAQIAALPGITILER